MRLIDADELPWVDKIVVLDMWDGDIRIEIKDNASYVDENTPTVEAIPIEWIRKWASINYIEGEYSVAVDMIEDWEKENDGN